MDLLVCRNSRGDVTAGSDERLLARAGFGDDLSLCVESKGTSEYFMFGNYAVAHDRVAGLDLVVPGSPESWSWYSLRSYKQVSRSRETLKALGDQSKIRLTFSRDFQIVVKPDIVYFPHKGRDYLIKSASVSLPLRFASDPDGYIQSREPFLEDRSRCAAYLNLGSDDDLIIVYKREFIDPDPRKRSLDDRTMVTTIKCEHTILAPREQGETDEQY